MRIGGAGISNPRPTMPPEFEALLLKTGQVTQYDGELDDGFYEMGIAKAYTILTAGLYAGISNIDLVHYTANTISFAATTPGTINDAANGLAMFKTGETIVITGSASNDGVYTISTGNVAATIRTVEATVLEGAGAMVSIAKREAHSNNCVRERNTGLMWSRYTSAQYATMGNAGDGQMPWTGQLYDIFQYAAAANAASLGGYTDWRVPNEFELRSLLSFEAPTAEPDNVAFPTWGQVRYWTSTSRPSNPVLHALNIDFTDGLNDTGLGKTSGNFCALVRGG